MVAPFVQDTLCCSMQFGWAAGLTGAVVIFAVGACKKDPPAASQGSATVPTATPSPEAGPTPAPTEGPGTWYRAKLVYKNVGDLPFFMKLPPKGEPGVANVVNAEETTDFKVQWLGDDIAITGPWNYTSVIDAKVAADGSLKGTWTRDTPLWGEVIREFSAQPIATPDPLTRFDGAAAPATSVAGIWEFTFAEHKEGKGVLEQTPDGIIRGYIKPGQLGDIRYLAGNLHGSKLGISHFNGNAANLVIADVNATGTEMKGTMSFQNVWNEKFTAKKVDDFKFIEKVHLKEGATTVSLPGLDKYRGKPTLAIIFATWCSSCNDSMPYLNQLYADYHPKGLEIYSVAYDLSDDVKANLEQLDYFRKKYDVKWEMTQVPCTPATWVDVMPKELDGWDGLPIMMLVRPDGTIQTVFGGWFGPATGEDGKKRQKWFESAVDALVSHAKG